MCMTSWHHGMTVWHNVTWRDVMWRDVMWRDVTWCNATRPYGMWRDVTWCDLMWHDLTLDSWHRGMTVWHNVTWCDLTLRYRTWRDVTWRDVTWRDATSWIEMLNYYIPCCVFTRLTISNRIVLVNKNIPLAPFCNMILHFTILRQENLPIW